MYLFCWDQYVFTCQNGVIDDEGDGGGIWRFNSFFLFFFRYGNRWTFFFRNTVFIQCFSFSFFLMQVTYVYSASFVELTSQCWLHVVIVMCSIVRAHLANGHCYHLSLYMCVSRITILICWAPSVHVSIDFSWSRSYFVVF